MALTDYEKELKKELLHSLGFPVVQVEIKDLDENWESIFKASKRWLRKFYAQKKVKAVSGFNQMGIPLSEIDADLKMVTKVIFPNSSIYEGLGLGQFYDDIPLGAGLNMSYVDYNTWIQHISEVETAKRVFGAESDWFTHGGKLKFNSSGRKSSSVIIEYTTKDIDSASVCSPWDDYYFRRLKAEVKEHIGRYRSKFGSYSTPGGDANLDGEKLLDESREDIASLREEITEDRHGSPIFLM